jgi:hypothetical protein
MKTLVSALAAAVLLAGLGVANAADQQTTSAEVDNMLNHEFTASGPYASARIPARVVSRVNGVVSSAQEIQAQDFQAQGSN